MPRYMANESENDYEPKTGRIKTRAALAAAVTDSPVRRSTRNRQGSVNPDGSSPESLTGSAAMITTRATRRRGAAATTESQNVPEPRALRSRRNSASSNISEIIEPESAPGTPKARAIKRLSIVESSPGTPKVGIKTRRSTRASSETKSPPPPVRTTRRTRATSIDPEPSIERAAKSSVVSTPTKKRRQQVSALPTEPVLTEEDNEDKIQQETKIDMVVTIPEEEIESESSPDKISIESSSRSPSPYSKKSQRQERTDAQQKDDENPDEKSPERSTVAEILSAKDKFRKIDEKEEIELLKTPEVEEQGKTTSAGNIEAQSSPKLTEETSTIKAKRHSLDKSRELGMKIENLLNKSTEEQEKSPGNKENEKLNVSPEKVKKNLEFTVSNVNISRGKSLGAPRFLNKSGDKKINSSLDERVLSKSRFDIEASKSFEVDNKSLNTAKVSEELNPGKKSESESPSVVKSAKKTGNQEAEGTESTGERSGSKISYTKIDETIVENEVIEEFTLDDSESEFSLAVEDDVENEKKNIDEAQQKQQSVIITERSESESSCDIFDLPNPLKNNSRKNSIEGVESKKQDTPKKRAHSYSKAPGESPEVSKSDSKQDKRKESTGKIDGKETNVETNNLEIERNSEKDIDQEEAMDTNEHEEAESEDKSQTVSPEKKALDKEVESLKVKNSENEVSDSDSNIVIDHLFQNISAEEWNKNKGKASPKEGKKKRKSSMKSLVLSEESDSEDDLIPVLEKSWKGRREASDSDDTLILKKNDSSKKANKKKKSDVKPIHKEAESEDELMEVSVESKKSPNKSRRSNTSVENSSNDKIQIEEEQEGDEKNSEAKSQDEDKEGPEIEDDISEAETISAYTDNIRKLEENSASKDVEKENELASSKRSPKNLKKKSKKSSDVYEFGSSEDEELDDKTADDSTDEEEKTELVNSKLRSQTKKRLGLLDIEPLTPMDKNQSTVAVVDSESDSGANLMPGYLFSVDSSDDEDYIAEEEKDNSATSIDSDIAKELNLAGKDDLEYSDDNVIADDCHDSESEYSDEADAGSDMDDFVVPDDEAESSEISEEEISPRASYRRILDKVSSSEEEGDEKIVTKNTGEKLKLNSLGETPAETDSPSLKEDKIVKSPELLGKRLNFSYESDVTASDKKTRKGKIVPNLIGESEVSESPGVEVVEKKSDKKLNKLSKPLRSLLNTTIDLCTPETNSMTRTKDKNHSQSPGLNNSLGKKLKKNLVMDLGTPILQDSNKTQEDEEDEDKKEGENEMEEEEEKEQKSVNTPQTKTPNKEKKTPKKGKKTPNKPHDNNKTQEDEDEEEGAESVFTTQTKTPDKEEKAANTSQNSNNTQEDSNEEEEDESVLPLQTKTPNKEKKTRNKDKKTPDKDNKTPNKEKKTPNTAKKTPKSAKKNTRDSMQLIEDAAVLKSSVSDLNKSMLTPNSESPVTKFLKKERLNESLPLLELKKRVSKTFDKKTLNKMDEEERETDDASETEEPEEANEESGDEENNENDDVEETEDEVNANGHKDDEDEDGTDKEEENGDVDEDNDYQLEDEESEESSEEELSKNGKKKNKNKNKTKTPVKAVKTPEVKAVKTPEVKADQKSRKSGGRKSVSELEDVFIKNGTDITPNKKDSAKRLSTASVTEKNTELNEDIVSRNKKRHLSTPGTELPTRKKRARLESSETPLGPKNKKKTKLVAKAEISLKDNKDESEGEDDDEAPESLGFGQARTAALKEMKDVASSLKAAKEAKKKKRRDQLERIKAEKESKIGKKSTQLEKIDPEPAKTNLKRLPEELLDNLTDEPQRPQKKRKLSKKDEKIVPSRFMFSPGKPVETTSLKVDDNFSPLSTIGGTTHFSVMNLEKVKKQPKKAAAVASFRDIMLARNPRQPISAFLVYKAKQKASGKQLSSRKQA